MSRQPSISGSFAEVTSHLRSKDFRWLKEDLGLFDMPDSWDLGNDNFKES